MSGQRSYLIDMIDSRCIPYGDLRHAYNSKTVPSRSYIETSSSYQNVSDL